MIKCRDRIIPDTDDIDVMGIIKLIEMDLESVRRNHLVEDGSITIFVSERLLLRLAQWKYKWMHLGFVDLKYTVDVGGHKDIDVNGQIFGCEIRLLHQWGMDIANAYRIQFEERAFMPLSPNAPLKWFHNYIDTDNSDELHWSVCSRGIEPKYIERFNTKEFVDGIIANYNKALINGIHGTLLDDIKKEDKMMKATFRINGDTDLAFRRFFDNGDTLLKHIKSVIINKKKGVTTVTWDDGDVTMVRPMPGVEWDDQQAIDECIMKKLFKTNSHHKKAIGKVIAKARVIEDKPEEPKKEHTNYIQEAVANYITGKSEE